MLEQLRIGGQFAPVRILETYVMIRPLNYLQVFPGKLLRLTGFIIGTG